MFENFHNFLGRVIPFRDCPSGIPHKVVMGVVVGTEGKKWCWHIDCLKTAWRGTDAKENLQT